MKSWKTTVAGLAMILGALSSAAVTLTDNDPATNPNWELVAAAIFGGFGLIAARDNKVTSEDAGAKPGNNYLPLVLALAILAPVPAMTTGCGTTPNRAAYIAEGIVITSVDNATDIWLDLVIRGKVTVQEEIEYRKKYNAYLRAQRVVQDLVDASEPGTLSDRTIFDAASKAVESASADIIAFVSGFANRR